MCLPGHEIDWPTPQQAKRWLLSLHRYLKWNDGGEVASLFSSYGFFARTLDFKSDTGCFELELRPNGNYSSMEYLRDLLISIVAPYGGKYRNLKVKTERKVRPVRLGFYGDGRDAFYREPAETTVTFTFAVGSRRKQSQMAAIATAHFEGYVHLLGH